MRRRDRTRLDAGDDHEIDEPQDRRRLGRCAWRRVDDRDRDARALGRAEERLEPAGLDGLVRHDARDSQRRS